MTEAKRGALIVEDEMLVALVARDIMDELGFDTYEAATAEQALRLAGDLSGKLSVALIDLGLPDMPGEKLIQQLGALCPDLPLIVASGKGAVTIDRGPGCANRIIVAPKPYGYDDIKAAIETLNLG